MDASSPSMGLQCHVVPSSVQTQKVLFIFLTSRLLMSFCKAEGIPVGQVFDSGKFFLLSRRLVIGSVSPFDDAALRRKLKHDDIELLHGRFAIGWQRDASSAFGMTPNSKEFWDTGSCCAASFPPRQSLYHCRRESAGSEAWQMLQLMLILFHRHTSFLDRSLQWSSMFQAFTTLPQTHRKPQ